jgi:hypothetical protein
MSDLAPLRYFLIQKLPSTPSLLITEMATPALGVAKTRPSGFPGLGQYFCNRKQIQGSTATKFRRSGLLSTGASSDAFPIGPPMLRPWGPPPMMYPPYPPLARWYGLWTPPPMHCHLGWLGPAGGFGNRGYRTGDGYYGGVVQQQIR